MKAKTLIKESRTVFRGLAGVSRCVGCSQTHLSRIMSGERAPGPELRRKLERIGIKFDKSTGLAIS